MQGEVMLIVFPIGLAQRDAVLLHQGESFSEHLVPVQQLLQLVQAGRSLFLLLLQCKQLLPLFSRVRQRLQLRFGRFQLLRPRFRHPAKHRCRAFLRLEVFLHSLQGGFPRFSLVVPGQFGADPGRPVRKRFRLVHADLHFLKLFLQTLLLLPGKTLPVGEHLIPADLFQQSVQLCRSHFGPFLCAQDFFLLFSRPLQGGFLVPQLLKLHLKAVPFGGQRFGAFFRFGDLRRRFPALGPQVFSSLIVGLLCLQSGDFFLQAVTFPLLFFGLLHPGLGLFQFRLPQGKILLAVAECRKGFLPLLRLPDPCVDAGKRLRDSVELFFQLRVRFLILGDQFTQQEEHFLRRQFSGSRLPHLFGAQAVFGAAHAADILPDAPPFVFTFTGEFPDVVLQSLLKDLIVAGMEDLAENRLAVLRLGQQQAQEVPLGDHGDLGKLVPVDAENVLDGCGHFPLLCHSSAVWADELGFRRLFRRAGSAAFCSLVFRLSRHGILLPRVGERQCHEGRPSRVGVLGPQHGGLAVVSTGLSVQGEGDRVENGRLPRAGIAGDQVQSALPQLLKVDGLLPRVGAEGRHDQIQRSHVLSSQMSSISAVT